MSLEAKMFFGKGTEHTEGSPHAPGGPSRVRLNIRRKVDPEHEHGSSLVLWNEPQCCTQKHIFYSPSNLHTQNFVVGRNAIHGYTES